MEEEEEEQGEGLQRTVELLRAAGPRERKERDTVQKCAACLKCIRIMQMIYHQMI